MNPRELPKFTFPGNLERYLATLSHLYAKKDKQVLQRVVVNARVRVDEGADYDNWDGGIWGHRVCMRLPFELYLDILDEKANLEEEIRNDLGKIMTDGGEYLSGVDIEQYEDAVIDGWREKSGALTQGSRIEAAIEDYSAHLWEPGFLRVFLSHKSEMKAFASLFQQSCAHFGISCFVAHVDIEPTKEWIREIELALFSMEVMLPLMTEQYSDSAWTDQEVGVAVGRGTPIVSVRMGKDPYGFIGRYQALTGIGKSAPELAKEIFQLFMSHKVLKHRMYEALVARFEQAVDFDHANELIKYIETIPEAPPELILRLEDAPGKNRQVRDAYRVEMKLPKVLDRLRGKS